MGITTDPNDPRLGRGIDDKPIPQHEVYLVLIISMEPHIASPVKNIFPLKNLHGLMMG